MIGLIALIRSRTARLDRVAWMAIAEKPGFSSAFVYGPFKGLLVVCSAWIWWQLRQDSRTCHEFV